MSHAMMLWAVAALLLIAAETMAPGIFLLWLGLAAGVMFFIVWLVPGLDPMWQAVAFVVLSLLSIVLYVRFVRGREAAPDQPLLNKRGEQLVGRVLSLHEPIVNGVGKVKLGDALWTVEGPDLTAGTSVRVVGATSMTLKVAPN
jgi:membrane protein implicated in regulation of membrane protease activity